ncbi:hypothetical protein [Streptomyces erythrochromogenes]|uniref:hypothetical protein n=1 Tax=Streptomyces erythrochromogenes TaxID=285574 RepID=UPI002258C839|nr:hypothetical protein [Streptomyces erythrochromogenes]MCX5589125.1 beta-lactamase family protein [Streptomyces erythrochromogenes]
MSHRAGSPPRKGRRKQFTADAVLLLAGRHRLALDDPLSDFVDNPPAWTRNVTLYQDPAGGGFPPEELLAGLGSVPETVPPRSRQQARLSAAPQSGRHTSDRAGRAVR